MGIENERAAVVSAAVAKWGVPAVLEQVEYWIRCELNRGVQSGRISEVQHRSGVEVVELIRKARGKVPEPVHGLRGENPE